MGNGAITSNDLMQKLVNAKKVMNKVDSGNYERGNIDEAALMRGNDEEEYPQINEYEETPFDAAKVMPKGVPTTDRINQSKLPDNIKKAMRETPIPQISLSETIDMDFVKGAKRLMEQEGVGKQQPQKKQQPQQNNNQSSNIDMNAIAVLIENTVRKVMDEKLNQILSAQTTSTINENLVLKVGDSIFRGKITGVNKAK